MRPIEVFNDNIARANALMPNRPGRGRGAATLPEKDSFRSAIVFAVSALDAYITDTLLENVIICYKHQLRNGGLNETMKNFVKNITDSIKKDVVLFLLEDNNGEESVRNLFRLSLANESFQSPWSIREACRMFRIDDIWEDVKTKLSGRPELTRITVNPEGRIRTIIQRRHDIVHNADKKDGHLVRLTKQTAKDYVDDIDTLVRAIDEIIEGKISGMHT